MRAAGAIVVWSISTHSITDLLLALEDFKYQVLPCALQSHFTTNKHGQTVGNLGTDLTERVSEESFVADWQTGSHLE